MTLLLLLAWLQVVPADTLGAPPPAVAADSLAGAAVEARLQALYDRIEAFKNVRVRVAQGVVHLEGTTIRPADREAAVELARRFEGVLFVENKLEAETDVETRLTPAVERVHTLVNRFVRMLPVLGVALLIVLGFALLARAVTGLEAPYRRLNPLLRSLVRRILRAVIVLLGLVLALDVLGVTALVGAMLGAAGVVGLALGFAFQDIVENYLAGALLSLRHPFAAGDLVRVGEHEGRVVRLTSRELVLLSFEGNHVRLPNALVFKSVLINYTRNPRRLFAFEVGVGVGEDLERAIAVGVATLDAMKGVLEDPPPFARVQALGESTVVVRFHGWVDQQQADFLKVQSEAIRLVKAALDEAGIDLPEPIYRVLLYPQEGAPPVAATVAPAALEALVQARHIDVAPDRKLEQQVSEDLASSDEDNFLQE